MSIVKGPGDKKILIKDLTPEQHEYLKRFVNDPQKHLGIFFKSTKEFQKKYSTSLNIFYQNRCYYTGYEGLKFRNYKNHRNIANFMECEFINDNTKARVYNDIFQSPEHFSTFAYYYPDTYMEGIRVCASRFPYRVIREVINFENISMMSDLINSNSDVLWLSNNNISRLLKRDSIEFKEKVFLLTPTRSARHLGKLIKNLIGQEGILSESFLMKMIEGNATSIQRIPSKYITYEMALMACRVAGGNIKYIKDEFKTQELCDIASLKTTSALKFIPKDKQNKSIILKKTLKGENVLKYIKTKERKRK